MADCCQAASSLPSGPALLADPMGMLTDSVTSARIVLRAVDTAGKATLMSVRVAVFDPLPVFRHGIMAALGVGGVGSEAPEDLMTWIYQEQRQVILMTLHSAEDWALLAQLHRARPGVVVVAVLEDTGVDAYVRALASGAVSAVPRDAPPEGIRQVFEAAVSGTSLLPTEVVRVLLSSRESVPDGSEMPSLREIEWLQQLADGITIAQLADRTGYSERAMYRLLRGLYTKLDVKTRTEALMLARARGWL
jgi:DNA-binding NarL/FixJ family response regulator